MTTGPPLIFIPVCPEHHVGGPLGYVRKSGLAWLCPRIARRKVPFRYREPELAAPLAVEQRTIDDVIGGRHEAETTSQGSSPGRPEA